MTLRRTMMVLGALALVLPGVAWAQSQVDQSKSSAAADRRGIYDFAVVMPGMNVGGRIVIKGETGKLEGTIAPDLPGEEPLAFDTVAVNGPQIHLVFTTGQGAAAIDLTPAGDSLIGKISGAFSGDVSAKKVR